MRVYINYPNPHITIHRNPDCLEIHKHRKEDQRTVTITVYTLPEALSDFIGKKYKFAASSSHNDLWLDISLNTPKQEESLVHVIQMILGLQYKPFEHAPITDHC